MNLLEKFESVTIDTDNRIAQTDRNFCEIQQSAYNAALNAFQELTYFWEDVKKTQEELENLPEQYRYGGYLTSSEGLEISVRKIEKQTIAAQFQIVQNIVRYFNSTYNVSTTAAPIIEKLFPEKPESDWRRDRAEEEAYKEKMLALRLRYQDIVDLIIIQLDGRNFAEQAFFELRQKCHEAAWNMYGKEARFVRKKNTLVFEEYSCRYDKRYSSEDWTLSDKLKTILRGIAHYETGSYSIYPLGFSGLLSYSGINTDVQTFPTCEKISQIKMFKNGRVDIKFSSDIIAEAFVTGYLGVEA